MNLSRHLKTKRTGLSLVEVLVAIIVLTSGALAAVSTQIATAHLAQRARTVQSNAQHVARLLDSLRGGPCASSSGTNTRTGAVFTWSVAPGADVALVRVQVTPTSGNPWAAETLVACP